MSIEETAKAAQEAHVTAYECRAMRQLDRDEDYSRSEIAFMFGTKFETVARHADRACHHNDLGPGKSAREYGDGELLTAFRNVYDSQEYDQMSQQVYNDAKPDEFPSASTIIKRFGSWTTARDLAWGEGE